MTRRLVAGVDCSTQSTKVVVCDADTGEVVRTGRAPHPDGTEIDPAVWLRALLVARGYTDPSGVSRDLFDGVEAISIAGQQHGAVCLDDQGAVVRPALLWNDTRSAAAATELVAEVGGAAAWAAAVGSVPVASFTVTKLRWIAEHEPALAERIASVMLPHDWLTHMLREDSTAEPTTDRGDASGTGYWSPATGEYRTDLLQAALGRAVALPRVAGPGEVVGQTPSGVLLAAGTGDNMGAALGLGLEAGDAVVSLGTSGTVFAVAERPTADATGTIAGFADATGRYLPLVCTLNASRVLNAAASMLDVDIKAIDDLAGQADPGAGGLTLLPYLDGERTPNLPDAKGLLAGVTRNNATPANLARAALEGMLCGLADGLAALREQGIPVRRVLLIGGAAVSAPVRQSAAALFGVPVFVPEPAEYVALGAARQAAWALSGGDVPPSWALSGVTIEADGAAIAAAGPVLERYAQVRDKALPLLS